jgi:4-hydroxy-tetrahydrodipicolinate synthase
MSRRLSAVLITLALLAGCQLCRSRTETPCCPPGPACWSGIYPTVLTPWACGGCGVDMAALAAQVDYQFCGRVTGLLVLGSLGEGEYADMAEREAVIRTAVIAARGRGPVIAGIHTGDVGCALDQLRQAADCGAAAVLVKFTGPPSTPFCDIRSFYQALAAQRLLPIFYYHLPGETKLRLRPEEVATILRTPGVIGIKESTLDLGEVERHVELTRGYGTVFLSGTALNLTQFQEVGGHGALCPEAAVLPGYTVRAYEAAYLAGDRAAARSMQRELFALAPVLSGPRVREGMARTLVMTTQDLRLPMPLGNPSSARLKAALAGRGVPISPVVKPPLPPLTEADARAVDQALGRLPN